MARILVTGGAGFIGSHLVDALVKKHHTVTVVDDLSSGRRTYVNPKARFIRMKIQSPKIATVFTKGKFQVIYHLAAQKNLQYSKSHPIEDAETNILGSIRLIEAARRTQVKKFIFYSTAAVYDPKGKLPNRETDRLRPITPYGIGKLTTEQYVQNSGLSYAILRLANVYGPRQDSSGEGGVVAIFCGNIAKGKRSMINNSGNQTRDLVYVGDVISASLNCLFSKNITCNISSNKEISVISLYKQILHVAERYMQPNRGKIVIEQKRSRMSNSQAKKQLKWFLHFPIQRGLVLTFNWFLIHGKK